MTHPRRVLRGQTLLITRRCARRCFFFKPTTRARSIMAYCLARAASQYSVEIHAFLFHVNHLHLVVSDPQAELPAFMHCLDTNLARSLNAHLGRGENFFAPGSYSKVELATRAAVLEESTTGCASGEIPPSPDEVLSTKPSSPDSIIRGTNDCTPWAGPVTLTPCTHWKSLDSVSHRSRFGAETPALLHNT